MMRAMSIVSPASSAGLRRCVGVCCDRVHGPSPCCPCPTQARRPSRRRYSLRFRADRASLRSRAIWRKNSLHRLCRAAHHIRARRHVGHHAALGADPRPASDPQMARQARLASDHDVVFQDRGTGNAGLRNDHAAASEAHVVRDLHQIVEARAGADDRVLQRSAIDRGVGADLDIVLDDHAAELRHAEHAGGRDRETEAVLSDARARRRCRRDRRAGRG